MKAELASFQTLPLKDAARQLLAKLGYKSEKFLVGAGSKPQDFLADFATGRPFDQAKALVSDWKSADLLFQLTDQELSRESSLFTDNSVQAALLKSYIFIAIELKGSDYARGKFSAITRQINRLFPMPVMVIFKHGDRLTIAVINRRRNKIDDSKDVLEKATLIRDISIANPHRGHLDILASLALPNLAHPKKLPIADFDTLHAAWEQIFNVELLNERFYRELANWYFWALPQVEFPADLELDDEKRRATGLIRLLTRLIFCWFLKEKGLIPEQLFHSADLAKILNGFDPESETISTYYQAILQNLFFATLNQRMGNDTKGQPYRIFAKDEGFQKNRATYDVNNLYRYEGLFREAPEAALAHFADIPFLNGGLFECLDRTEEEKKRYLDGFSRNPKKRPHVPDRLFFDSGEIADLSEVYDDKKRKAEKVTGLITILNRYKFTIVENTPIDQEIALDPELLGKVFENLLASYNEETKTTARKQTGSFYTPRPIVDYMVDESLKAHLPRKLEEAHAEARRRGEEPNNSNGRQEEAHTKAQRHKEDEKTSSEISSSEPLRASASPRETRLSQLFSYTEQPHQFSEAEVATLIAAIDEMKILDPACGSGAFPMGVLHKLVTILGKLDPDNTRWKQTQLQKLDSAPMREELERAFADNNDDYGRKLYLIENCLYGVDIQPIAIQITKLRFFISLVCDQNVGGAARPSSGNKPGQAAPATRNHGIRPLPNLETKFVAANTLIGLPEMEHDLLINPRIAQIEKEIQSLYHSHFSIQRRDQKLSLQKKIQTLRRELARLLGESLLSPEKAKHLAEWDPFDPQSTADFFDPYWMFGIHAGSTLTQDAQTLTGGFSAILDDELTTTLRKESGFDITIGNPPYVRADEQSESNIAQRQAILASKQYDTLWEKWDLYVPFLERSFKLLRPDGISTMIVSDAFCHSKYAQKAQNWFLKNARILRLDFCGEVKIFEAAVHNIITCFQKAEGANWKPERRLHREVFGEVTELPSDEQTKLTHRVFFPEDAPTEAFDCKSILLDAICYISVGLVAHADEKVAKGEFQLEDLVSRTRDAKHPKPFVEGKHLERWLPADQRWLEWGTPRSPALLRRQTFEELYSVPEKIFIHRTGGEGLRSAYDQNQTLCNHTIIVCLPWQSLHGVRNKSLKKSARYQGEKPPRPDLPKREELEATSRRFAVKYLLGVMNSASAREFLRANRRSNTDLYPDDWKKLPIPDVSAAQQKPIIALVEQILTSKRANPAADINTLETQIDAAVAKLYGLTPEEIAIVEGTAP